MAIQINHSSPAIVMSSAEASGVADGITWHFHGDTPGRHMTKEDGLDFLQGNFVQLALEGYLDEERSRENASFLIGWFGAERAHPDAFALNRCVGNIKEKPFWMYLRRDRCRSREATA